MVGPKRAIFAAAPLLLLLLHAAPAPALDTRRFPGRAPAPAIIFRGGLGNIERTMIGKVGTYLTSAAAGYIGLLKSAPVSTKVHTPHSSHHVHQPSCMHPCR